MSLEQKINDDIKAAMLAKDKMKLEALRAVKSAILLAKTDKGAGGDIAEDAEMKILQKLVKQRRDSAQLYNEQGRADLAEEEQFQLEIIEKYLPAQMSEEDVTAVVVSIIEETGASSMKDMGRVMGMASKKLAGQADNKLISEIVKNYNLITKSNSKNNNLNYNLNQLATENRGEILAKLGKGMSTRYTFKNPMMRAFIKLKMNSK